LTVQIDTPIRTTPAKATAPTRREAFHAAKEAIRAIER